MRRLASFIVSSPRRILGATAAISIVAALSLIQIRFNPDVTSFITQGNPEGEAFAELQDKYGINDPVTVVLSLPAGETFTERENLTLLVEYRDELAAMDGVDSVSALVPTSSPIDGRAITPELLAMAPQGVLSAITEGPIAELLLSEDGRHTMLMVAPHGDGIDIVRNVGSLPIRSGVEVTVAGNPAIYAAVVDILSLVLLAIPPVVLVLLVGIFYLNVGDPKLSALAVLPALVGSLWTFGLLAGVGVEIDIVTVIVPIFVLVMGSADGLHFVTHFQDVARETEDPIERVVSTLREVGTPMILTTVSTAAGFLSLLATGIEPIRELGIFTAAGIAFAGLISFFSLPAAMLHVGVRSGSRPARLGDKAVRAIRAAARRRGIAAIIVGLVVVFSAIFIPRLEVDSDPLFMFTGGHEVRAAFDRIEGLFGGATPLFGEFVLDRDDPEGSLDRAIEASAELEALPGVRSIFSIADLAPTLSEDVVVDAVLGERDLGIDGLVSEDGLRFTLFPESFTAEDLRGWVEYESDAVRIITGLPVLWDEMARMIVETQVWSLIAALGLVFVLLLATYRKIGQTLVAVLPIILTVAALLGFIAASGFQLNMITAVASSIVIGVGIDYAIHFIAAITYARPEGSGYVLRAIDRSGRPIIANALGIAIALSALLLSPLRTHHHLSGIMWVSMVVAALGALVVIPAFMPREGVHTNES